MFAGIAMSGFAVFCYMSQSSVKSTHHKLGASLEGSSNDGTSSIFNGISVVIWSMIAAKAKTGMSAAQDGSAKTVGGYLQQAGSLILMIALASGFNIYSQMDQVNFEAPTVSYAKPTL